MDDWFKTDAPVTTPADFVWLLDLGRGQLHRFHKADAQSDLDELVPSCFVGEGCKHGISRGRLTRVVNPGAFALVTCTRCLVADIELRNSNCREIGCCPEPEWPPAGVTVPPAG